MRWLSSSKVRLALIVNGLYFISVFTPTTQHSRPRFFAHTHEAQVSPLATLAPPVLRPDYAPYPPPSPRSNAVVDESNGLLNVSLDRDLTLVKRPDRELLLSLNFSARTKPRALPEYIFLTFHLYTDQTSCPYDCPVNVIADDKSLTPVITRPDNTTPASDTPRQRPPFDGEPHVETKYLHWVSARISLQEFMEIINAKRVLVGLGPDWVELNSDQMSALREMFVRLPLSPSGDSDSNSDTTHVPRKRLVKRRS
jgi:hypothetical protein